MEIPVGFSEVWAGLWSQVLVLWRTLFPAHTVIVHSAWDWPEAKTLTSTSFCAVKKFCQRALWQLLSKYKKKSIRTIFWKTTRAPQRKSFKSQFSLFNSTSLVRIPLPESLKKTARMRIIIKKIIQWRDLKHQKCRDSRTTCFTS